MRILFLSDFYPPYEIGGYEQWCEDVARGLIARDHEVSILTSRYAVPAGQRVDKRKVSRELYLQADIDYYRPIDFFLRRSYEENANIQVLRRKIDEFRPDIVMVWGMWNLSHLLPYWAERWMPSRVAYFISNYWPIDIDPHTAYWKIPTRRRGLEIIKRPLRTLAISRLRRDGYPPRLRFEHVVCCSEYVRNILVEAGKLPLQAGVLYGGTDPEPFLKVSKVKKNHSNGKNRTLNLLYFGRLIYDKGVHTAIEAIGILKQKGLADRIQLTILGSGHPDYEAKLRKLIIHLDVGEQIEFVSQVPRPDVPELLGRFDVYLFTSIWPEPMARSVMEAMAAKLLVIGTEVGGQVEMLADGQNALTFGVDDSEDLSIQITRAFDDPQLRLRLARAGQETVLERFTLERMINEIEDFLLKIVQVS